MAEASDAIETEVLQWLTILDVGKLEEVCGILEIEIPEAKGKKFLLCKLIFRFLHSEDLEGQEDHGHSTFLNLHTILKGSSTNQQTLGPNEEVLSGDEHLIRESDHKSYMKVHRLCEFKINGTIGPTDQRENLSYTSLSFQMEKGKKAGYSVGEIQTAVIKAIKHGSSLRVYLESKVDIDEQAFIVILQSRYKEKESTSVLQEMSNSVQLSSESELGFCLHVMSLREKVLALSREEACPFDVMMVRKRFFHAIVTGLKHNNIRLKLKKVLKTGTVSDEELLHEISLTTSIELEHVNKFAKTKANVNEIRTDKGATQFSSGNCSERVFVENIEKKENSLMTNKKMN